MTKTLTRSRAPARHIPANRDEAAAALERLALLRAALKTRLARLDADVAVLQAQTAADCEGLVAEAGELEETIRLYCEAHRAALTDDGRTKTVRLGAAGTVSWRNRPASIEVTDQVAAVASLRAAGLVACIRTVEAVDKAALMRTAMVTSDTCSVALQPLGGLRFVPGAEDCIVKTSSMGAA